MISALRRDSAEGASGHLDAVAARDASHCEADLAADARARDILASEQALTWQNETTTLDAKNAQSLLLRSVDPLEGLARGLNFSQF